MDLLPCSSSVHLAFEMFQERGFQEMLAVSYLVLQACISFLRRFRHEWRTFVLHCRKNMPLFICMFLRQEIGVVGKVSKGKPEKGGFDVKGSIEPCLWF